MSNLADLIKRAITMAPGNKDFALFHFDDDGSWRAEVGNSCPHVMLGEIRGDYDGEGETVEAALEALIASLSLEEQNKSEP